MESNRKELEQLLRSLQPSGLSESTLDRLEQAMSGSVEIDPSIRSVESQLLDLRPRAIRTSSLDQFMAIVQDVPFAVDQKVVLFPGVRKEMAQVASQKRRWFGAAAMAAMAAIGALAAVWTPLAKQKPVIAGELPKNPPSQSPVNRSPEGIVATSFGTGVERAADEGVIWTPDHQPKRVLRFQYQDRVLVRDKNGVDRMLLIPREELFVVPEKVD
ncbi:MAG: hypothetical protein ACOVRB_09580 [Akkermansiaceae bacterium]